MTSETDAPAYMTYDEAAVFLGVKTQSVYQMAARGVLHSAPNPNGSRKKVLARQEVAEYARVRAMHPTGVPARAIRSLAQDTSPQKLAMIGAGIGIIALMILALQTEEDAIQRALIIGALVALALVLLATWQEEGKIDWRERRRLETLARQAETAPEPFISELQALIGAA